MDPIKPEAHVQIVSLPLASHLLLRPREDSFAQSLAEHGDGDVRGTLTNLMNRYPAVSTHATLSLVLDGTSHLVDVVAISGWRHMRRGTCTESALPPASAKAEKVSAACLVDADVEVDFAPSLQAEASAKAQAQAATSSLAAEGAVAGSAMEPKPEAVAEAAQAPTLEELRAARLARFS